LRLGVYGGTFDPVHMAHLILAECARDSLKLDSVLFVPSYIPPHKKNVKISAAVHRLRMLELAIEPDSGFAICDYEVHKQGTSYTVDTLLFLQQKYAVQRDDFYLIIGADNMKDFSLWKEPDKIAAMTQIVVAGRSNLQRTPSRYPSVQLDFPQMDISSSLIRNRVHEGKSIKYFTPAAVVEYIQKNRLYL